MLDCFYKTLLISAFCIGVITLHNFVLCVISRKLYFFKATISGVVAVLDVVMYLYAHLCGVSKGLFELKYAIYDLSV